MSITEEEKRPAVDGSTVLRGDGFSSSFFLDNCRGAMLCDSDGNANAVLADLRRLNIADERGSFYLR